MGLGSDPRKAHGPSALHGALPRESDALRASADQTAGSRRRNCLGALVSTVERETHAFARGINWQGNLGGCEFRWRRGVFWIQSSATGLSSRQPRRGPATRHSSQADRPFAQSHKGSSLALQDMSYVGDAPEDVVGVTEEVEPDRFERRVLGHVHARSKHNRRSFCATSSQQACSPDAVDASQSAQIRHQAANVTIFEGIHGNRRTSRKMLGART
jgi:hypothetical protein